MTKRCEFLTDLGSFPGGTELTVRVKGEEGKFATRLFLESTDPAVNKTWVPQGKFHHTEEMPVGHPIQVKAGHLYQAMLFTAWLRKEPTDVTVVWQADGTEIYTCTSSGKKSDGVADWAFWFRGEE